MPSPRHRRVAGYTGGWLATGWPSGASASGIGMTLVLFWPLALPAPMSFSSDEKMKRPLVFIDLREAERFSERLVGERLGAGRDAAAPLSRFLLDPCCDAGTEEEDPLEPLGVEPPAEAHPWEFSGDACVGVACPTTSLLLLLLLCLPLCPMKL